MYSKPSFYDILGIPQDATVEEIRRAYRNLSRKKHPDLNRQPSANTQFLTIQEAYDTIFDPNRRKAYDERLLEENNDPISITTRYSRSCISTIDEPQLIYTLIDFVPTRRYVSSANPALNLCIIIDRSTSMQGIRLDTVKSAAVEVVRQTQPEDILSLVTFSDRAELVQPAERLRDRQMFETQIQLVQASGGTEIYQGLEAGFQQIQRNLNRALVNHIILITDGHTYGDEQNCLELAYRAAAQGVRITSLGIGTEWNDSFLDELSNRTGGNTFFISNPNELHQLMKDKISNLAQVFAEHVIIELQSGTGVVLNAAYRLQPEATSLSVADQIRLGSILKTSNLSVLFEFVVQPLYEQMYRREIAAGTLSFVLPTIPTATHNKSIRLSRIMGESDPKESPPLEISDALANLSLYRMQESARQYASEGKAEEASRRLNILATQFQNLGESDLAQTALVEAQKIQQNNKLSAEGKKRMKYGTRALLLPARFREGGRN